MINLCCSQEQTNQPASSNCLWLCRSEQGLTIWMSAGCGKTILIQGYHKYIQHYTLYNKYLFIEVSAFIVPVVVPTMSDWTAAGGLSHGVTYGFSAVPSSSQPTSARIFTAAQVALAFSFIYRIKYNTNKTDYTLPQYFVIVQLTYYQIQKICLTSLWDLKLNCTMTLTYVTAVNDTFWDFNFYWNCQFDFLF